MRSAGEGRIRPDRSLRSATNIDKIMNPKRINYPLFEETKELITKNIIKYSYTSYQQPDGSWKDSDPATYITKLHFMKNLSEEDREEANIKKELSQKIKRETSHIGKPQATKKDAETTLENNKKEIHSKHSIPNIIDKTDNNIMKNYIQNLINDLEAKQKQEREELEYKIKVALSAERDKAKKAFITSLANGMTITEAIENLKSAKHNDILIQAVLEEIKTEILSSLKKNEIIKETTEKLENSENRLKHISKKLLEVEKSNKTNYENYIREVNKRKEADIAISKLKNIADKLNDSLKASKLEIMDLKAEIVEKNRLIDDIENELEKEFNEIENLNKKLKEKEKKIDNLETESNKLKETIQKKRYSNSTIKNKTRSIRRV